MDSIMTFQTCRHGLPTQAPLILAVDDDDDNLLLLSYAIELFDCRFVGRTSCHAALPIVRQCQPDLILMDILMPEQDGISFMRHLRQNATTCQIPIIAVTALARAEDREAILLSGFTDYLSKPYLLDDLESLVQQHLGQRVKLKTPV